MAHQHFSLRRELLQAAVGRIVEFGCVAELLRQRPAGQGQGLFVGAVQGHQHQSGHQAIAELRYQQALLRCGGRRQECAEIGFDAQRSRRKQDQCDKTDQRQSVAHHRTE